MVPTDEIARRLATRLADQPGEPMAHVIAEDIWLAVVKGRLGTGERLPTQRELAIALGVSPRTVERAYAELGRRGVTAAQPGAGTFVSLVPPDEAAHARYRDLAALCRDTVARADELGFGVDDLLEALAEYRAETRRGPSVAGEAGGLFAE